jgi:hypothetical protein
MGDRASGERELTPAQFAALRARYPGQSITVERDGNYVRIFADDEQIAKAVLLSSAFLEAMRI